VASVLWRVLPRAVPAWTVSCDHCSATGLECTGRFRVNANGALHDVWLLYACPACGRGRRRSVHRRVRESAALPLAPFRRDDPGVAALWAFALSRGTPVPYRVERPALVGPAGLALRIEQPFPCGARWDALLARELGVSRSRLRVLWRAGAVCTADGLRPGRDVRDGDRLALWLDERGRPAAPRGPPPSPERGGHCGSLDDPARRRAAERSER